MSMNAKKQNTVSDDTIRIRRVDGKYYQQAQREVDRDRENEQMARNEKKRNPWKTAFVGLVILAAVVVALWWAGHVNGSLAGIRHQVAQNGQQIASQGQQMSRLQQEMANLQSQFQSFSTWAHQAIGKLMGMMSSHG